MKKIGFSFKDDVTKELEALVKKENRAASEVIVDALSEYFKVGSPPPDPQAPHPPEQAPPQSGDPPPPSPSPDAPAADPRIDAILAWMKNADQKITDFGDQLAEAMKLLGELKKDVGDLDERQGRLWHEIHDK